MIIAQSSYLFAVGTAESCVIVDTEAGTVSAPTSLEKSSRFVNWRKPAPTVEQTNLAEKLAASRVTKFNPNHDERGRFAHSRGADLTGVTFVSPERRTGRSLDQAMADLGERQQTRLKAAMRAINERLGIGRARTRDVVGIWIDPTAGIGAEASTMTRTSRAVDLERMTVAACMAGWLAEQKGVIAFKPGAGEDMLFTVKGLRGKPEALYRSFQERGVENVTLVPRADGLYDAHTVAFHGFVGDEGLKSTADAVIAVGKSRGAQFTFTQGAGNYVGEDTRDAARKAYEAIIDGYRSHAVVTPRTLSQSRDGGRDRLGWWDTLASEWRRGQGHRGEGLAKRVVGQIADVLDAWKEQFLHAIEKYNHNHDERGRFSSGSGGSSALSYAGAPRTRFHADLMPFGIESDAHLPPDKIIREGNVFAPMNTDKQRHAYRNIAASMLYADAVMDGSLRRKLTDARIRERAVEAHPDFKDLTDKDIVAIRNKFDALKEDFADTDLPHWDHVEPLIAEGKAAGADWYDDKEDVIGKVFNPTDARVFRAFLAVTSAGNMLTSNLTKGLSFYLQWRMNGRRVPPGGFIGDTPNNRDAARDLLIEGVSRGSKIGQFVAALEGDRNAVVVDRWMARAFKLKKTDSKTGKRVPQDSPSEHAFVVIDRLIRSHAAKTGMDPRAVQASIWRAQILRDDPDRKNIDSYDRLLQQRAARIPKPKTKEKGPDGKFRPIAPHPDTEFHEIIPTTAAETWHQIGGSTIARDLLRALLKELRGTLKKLTGALDDGPVDRLHAYAGLIAIAENYNETAWRAHLQHDLGTKADVVTWEEALMVSEWIEAIARMMPEPVDLVEKFNHNHDTRGRFASSAGGASLHPFVNPVMEQAGVIGGIGMNVDQQRVYSTAETPHEKSLEKAFHAAKHDMPAAVQQAVDAAETYFINGSSGRHVGTKAVGFFAAFSPIKTSVSGDPWGVSFPPAEMGHSFLISGGKSWPYQKGVSREQFRESVMKHEMSHLIDRLLFERATAAAHPTDDPAMAAARLRNAAVASEEMHKAVMWRAMNADIKRSKRIGTTIEADAFLSRWAQGHNPATGAIYISAAEQFADASAYLFGATRIREHSAIRFRRTFPHAINMAAKIIAHHAPDIAAGFKRRPPTASDISAFDRRIGKVDEGMVQYADRPSTVHELLDANGARVAFIERPESWGVTEETEDAS